MTDVQRDKSESWGIRLVGKYVESRKSARVRIQHTIHTSPANPEPAGNFNWSQPLGLECPDFLSPSPCSRFSTLVFSVSLRLGDSFPLPLQHQFALEGGDCADDG